MKSEETETKVEQERKADPLTTDEKAAKALQEIYEQRKIRFGNTTQTTGPLNQPIYNFFNYFIGGPNEAKIVNEQQGKPNQPPY